MPHQSRSNICKQCKQASKSDNSPCLVCEKCNRQRALVIAGSDEAEPFCGRSIAEEITQMTHYVSFAILMKELGFSAHDQQSIEKIIRPYMAADKIIEISFDIGAADIAPSPRHPAQRMPMPGSIDADLRKKMN